MSFPETRQTLIRRLASSGGDDDWQQFMADYWRPVCRFASRWGHLNIDDAEDVASLVFESLVKGRLLQRWTENRNAKLRTLLCGITRNVLSNRARIESGRSHLLREDRAAIANAAIVHLEAEPAVPDEQEEAFYKAWVDELLADAVESLQQEYLSQGRGDYFRVLYGRVCEGMKIREIADCLQMRVTVAENSYKHAIKRFGETLRKLVRERLHRYTDPDTFQTEFQAEWNQLSRFLRRHGGIEEAIRQIHTSGPDSAELKQRERAALTTLLTVGTDKLGSRSPDDASTD